MTDATSRPPGPTPEHVLEELERHDDAARTVEEVGAMSPEAHKRELAEAGYTEGDLAKLLARTRGADAPAPRDLGGRTKPTAAKARRGRGSPMDLLSGWGMVAVAAAALLYLWMRRDKGPDRNVAADAGVTVVDAATSAPEVAKRLRADAAALCNAGRYEECQAKLDEARAIDPKGEGDDSVRAMRSRMQGPPPAESAAPTPPPPPPAPAPPKPPRVNHAPGDKGPGLAPRDPGPSEK